MCVWEYGAHGKRLRASRRTRSNFKLRGGYACKSNELRVAIVGLSGGSCLIHIRVRAVHVVRVAFCVLLFVINTDTVFRVSNF